MKKRWMIWGFGLALLGLVAWAGVEASLLVSRMGCFALSQDVARVEIAPSPDGATRFIALGDTGTGKPEQMAVAQAARRWCREKGCDFIALLGDNLYPSGLAGKSDPRFQTLVVEPYGALNLPIAAILGNHDVYSDAIHQVRATLRFPLWRMPNYRYDFRVGAARFHAVNTNCHWWDWLRLAPRLEDTGAWTFVLAHHALYGTAGHGDSDPVSLGLWGWLAEPKVDFVLSGHNHILEVLDAPGRRAQYVVIGSSGGGDRRERRKPRPRMKSEARSLYYSTEPGFAWFEVSPGRARGVIVNQRGETLFEFSKLK